ncbi:hypothetical protein GQ55_9G178200 [Panicum hallii var. hallii]|uniref:Bifunctional inhibitor/plant lipid transfer protein/seed storage helical domain-containing protein n=1 Tax=Panicum hallii var. hallii TaxID=1504633 RepID=A0A2T7C4F4_9POAL|nr:hypothetical protein GQ55_9G178200 [Panicum hallii var. hallii]
MASPKVFALFALLALCAVSASATSDLRYAPPMMQPYPLAMLQQQRCMALMVQGIMSPECQQLGAMYPITQQMQMQQYCIPPVMQGVMAPRCQCGSMCQMPVQLPYMYSTAAMRNPLAYPQQCVAGCSC